MTDESERSTGIPEVDADLAAIRKALAGGEGEEGESEDPRKMYEAAKATIKVMEELMASKGWKYLEQVLTDQVETRKSQCLRFTSSFDTVLEQQAEKGELAGLQLALSMPKYCVESAQYTIDRLKGNLSDGSDS